MRRICLVERKLLSTVKYFRNTRISLARVADRDEPPDAPLAARLAQERLLPGGADEVVVRVAVAHVVERVLALELLVARVDVDRRVRRRAR